MENELLTPTGSEKLIQMGSNENSPTIDNDLGSHLLDLCLYWFGEKITSLKIIELNKFENKAPDHAVITLEINPIHNKKTNLYVCLKYMVDLF